MPSAAPRRQQNSFLLDMCNVPTRAASSKRARSQLAAQEDQPRPARRARRDFQEEAEPSSSMSGPALTTCRSPDLPIATARARTACIRLRAYTHGRRRARRRGRRRGLLRPQAPLDLRARLLYRARVIALLCQGHLPMARVCPRTVRMLGYHAVHPWPMAYDAPGGGI